MTMIKLSQASTILSCIGAAGVVLTSVLTAKATPKAETYLQAAEVEKSDKLTKFEMVKAVVPAYIPAMISGALTIACIFSANVLNKRQQAALTSAYALLNNYHREYASKVKELYGEDTDDLVKRELVKDKYEEHKTDISEGEVMFYDIRAMNYFTSTVDKVLDRVVMEDGRVCYMITTPFDDQVFYPYF